MSRQRMPEYYQSDIRYGDGMVLSDLLQHVSVAQIERFLTEPGRRRTVIMINASGDLVHVRNGRYNQTEQPAIYVSNSDPCTGSLALRLSKQKPVVGYGSIANMMVDLQHAMMMYPASGRAYFFDDTAS